ncbi:MAG: acetyltransferase, family [bacterium]|nr:acetyltransferase, family [bacterium]
MAHLIRPLTTGDLPAVLALNNAHAVEVNALTTDALAALVAIAAQARVVDGGIGFLIALSERTPPQGPNHAWFLARHSAFLYIDRVVIAPEARGRGHARRMYEDLAAIAGDRPLCCEVNLVPPNPGSLAFHDRLGFTACGEADDPRNGKRVRYLVRPAARSRI